MGWDNAKSCRAGAEGFIFSGPIIQLNKAPTCACTRDNLSGGSGVGFAVNPCPYASTPICFGQPGLVQKELSAKPNFGKAEAKLSRVSKKNTSLVSITNNAQPHQCNKAITC